METATLCYIVINKSIFKTKFEINFMGVKIIIKYYKMCYLDF